MSLGAEMSLRPPRLLLWLGLLPDDDGIPSVAVWNRLLCEEVVVHDDLTPNSSNTAIVWKVFIFLLFVLWSWSSILPLALPDVGTRV